MIPSFSEPVFTVTVTALPSLVAVTALPTKSKLRTILLNGVPSFDAVMFNPAPPPPPPASVDKSTEFPPEILNAFVPSLNDSVCAEPVSSVAVSKVVNLVPIDDDTDGNVVSLKLVFAVIEFF